MNNITIEENPKIKNVKIYPIQSHLFIPPIVWRGDPEGHIGENDTFFYVTEGEIGLFIEEDGYILRSGDLAFLPKGKRRAYTTLSDTVSLYEINFGAQINDMPWHKALRLEEKNYSVHPSDEAAIRTLFESSVRYELNKLPCYDIVFCANIASLISIYADIRKNEQRLIQPFGAAERFMKENIGRSISLTELSEVSFTESTYFIRKFKAAYGLSPIAYFNKMKIYRAMFLLCSTNLSVFDIAKEIGVQDSSYFTRLFKSVTSVTPSEYRHSFAK